MLGRLDGHTRELAHGASVAFVLKIASASLSFTFNLLIARLLGADGAGAYFLALSVALAAGVVGRLGLDNVLLRRTAAGAAEGDWGAVNGAYRRGMVMALLASAAAASGVVVLAPWLAGHVFDDQGLANPMRWMALAVPPAVMVLLHAEVLKGLKRILASQVVQGVGTPALSVIALAVLAPRLGILGAVWAYVIGSTVTATVGTIVWRRVMGDRRRVRGDVPSRQLLRASMPLLWVASMSFLMTWTATLLLGVWATNEEVGIFSVASRTALLTSFILTAVNSIAAPKYAELYQRNDHRALDATARQATRFMTLAAAPLLVLFVAAPVPVMRLFGQQFVEGATVLAILGLGQFINVATGSVSYLLMMTGRERLMRNIVVASAVTHVAVNAVLIPRLGAVGAAIATALSLAIMNLTGVVVVYRQLAILTLPVPSRWVGVRSK
jgi:O-antigen/teichoic acid export membrane protein